MTITAYPRTPRADASSLLAFDGPANVLVAWSVVSGPGTVTPITNATDETGRAWALYEPNGVEGAATVEVTYGT